MNYFLRFPLYIASIVIIIGILFFSACSKEGDNGIDDCPCENDAVCINDNLGGITCVCAEGYFGVSCENFDTCYNVVCAENQICTNGVCDCAPGFEGADCQELIREKYLGNYQAIDVCPGGTYGYPVTIKTSDEGAQFIILEGFGSFTDPVLAVKAEVIDTYTFEIPVGNYPGVTIQGGSIGQYDADTGVISISYQSTLASNTETCHLTLNPE